MTRADDIIEMVEGQENFYSDGWRTDMLNWLGEREDKEIVEIMRGCLATLSFRSVTLDSEQVVAPTAEVFLTAVERLAEAFNRHAKEVITE